MTKIRVLIVDDAVVVRRMVSDALAADSAIEIAGTAANGRIALAKIPQINPDIITLDMEMPEMNGLETLAAIRKQYRTLPVIMFSTLTQRGASTTIDALSLGANDYVTKPANVGSVAAALQCLREQLIPKIKALCVRPTPTHSALLRPTSNPVAPNASRKPVTPSDTIDVVTIGVSTGGPNALSAVLPALPHDFPVPILIVQHMPPVFTRLLAERLDTQCSLHVSEAAPGDEVCPGRIYIAPGQFHMVAHRFGAVVKIDTNEGPPENSCRPAVDVLFRSVADTYGGRTLAVILTGMGQDGLRGCERIREVGGQILAQDEETSVVWGMPGFVAKNGLADSVLPLDQVAPEILRRVAKARNSSSGRMVTCRS